MPEFNPTIHCYLRQPNNRGKAALKNYTGQRFNRLLVFSFLGMTDSAKGCRDAHWLCRCDCGKWWTATASNLKRGITQSCGCWNYDKTPYSKTHGMSNTLVHRIWSGIRTRITNSNHHSYPRYGGKGLTLCEGMQSFEDFYAVVGDPPKGKDSIDRWPNNKDGGYWCGRCDECSKNGWPKNVRWADDNEQAANRKSNVWLTHNGETLIIAEWARRLNRDHRIISALLKQCKSNAEALGLSGP
jgi:hypothetical protein